jgi:hypothetical protein
MYCNRQADSRSPVRRVEVYEDGSDCPASTAQCVQWVRGRNDECTTRPCDKSTVGATKKKKKVKKEETSSSNPPSARLFMSIRVAAIVGHVSRVRRLFIVIRVYTITALCSSLFFVKSLAHLLFWFDSGKLFKAQFYYY